MSSVPSLIPAESSPHIQTGRAPGLAPLWTLYVLTLRQHLHGKRWMVISLLMLLPAGVAILARSTAHNVPSMGLEFMLAFMFLPQALLPFFALIYASGIIIDEQEEQTITYLLVRPMPKWAIYVVRLLATLTTAIFLTVLFTILTYIVIYYGASDPGQSIALRCFKACCIHALAISAYCCIFGFMSMLTKRVLIVGIVYIALVEGFFANLPFGIRLITVIYHTRLIAYRAMDFVLQTPNRSEDLAAAVWNINIADDPQLLEHPRTTTCLTVLFLGSIVCTALAAWICSRREFHVKTPEKA